MNATSMGSLNIIFSWFNRQNTAVLIFILCLANFFGLTLEGGEEQYFAFARQYMDPTWMPHSFTLNHPAGGNLAFQVIAGFLLKYISFEQLAIWGRVFNFALYAIPLSLIFRELRISNIEMVFLLQVIFFGHQSLYAGEWIFKNFEEKSVAYVFVFWSVWYLLNNKPLPSSAFAAVATYFHFLVGGWMFAFVFIYFIVRQRNFRSIILTGLVYLAITLPLIIYLYKTYMVNNPAMVNGVNTSVIYAFWRLRHHIGLFDSLDYFLAYPFGGVLITMILFAISVFVFRKFRQPDIKQLNTLNIIIFSQQLIFLIIGIFDRNGELMKTYPFRTNSLSVLLFLMEATLIMKWYLATSRYPVIIRKYLGKQSFPARKRIYTNRLNLTLMLIILPVFIVETTDMVKNLNNVEVDLDSHMLDLIDYVKENTPPSAVFIFADGDRPYSFTRRAERERFVVVKFTPTRSAAIAEWYKRARLKERLRKDITVIDSIKTAYPINYLVTDSVYCHPSLLIERQFGTHHLYKIR